ncbi:hypothetical protein BH24ACT5_BH24ACT5_10720 [soil metagenome]
MNGINAPVIRTNVAATALFAATAALAAALFTTVWQWIGAVTALALFAVGVFAFLWSYWQAVQRSRTEEISVVQLYLLAGEPTPTPVRRIMLGLLFVQIAIATVTTFARLDGPDGDPGSSLAVGFLVPMLGFGLNGLWAARYGVFGPRPTRDSGGSDTDAGGNAPE